MSPIMLALVEADAAALPGVKEYVQRVLECLVLASKVSCVHCNVTVVIINIYI